MTVLAQTCIYWIIPNKIDYLNIFIYLEPSKHSWLERKILVGIQFMIWCWEVIRRFLSLQIPAQSSKGLNVWQHQWEAHIFFSIFTSAVWLGGWIPILEKIEQDILHLSVTEALFIRELKPALNTRDEFRSRQLRIKI